MLRPALLLAALAAAALGACGGEVVETGPSATVGEGFEEVFVTEVPTTAPGSTVPGQTGQLDFAVGDCLWWDTQAAQAGFRVVACTEEHLAEVAGKADLAEAFAVDAAFPEQEALQVAVAELCGPIVTSYLGGDLAEGVEPGVIPPTEDTWAEGDRIAWCTVGRTRSNGIRPPYTGSLADGSAST